MGRDEVEALFERARLARETACLLRSRREEARLERDRLDAFSRWGAHTGLTGTRQRIRAGSRPRTRGKNGVVGRDRDSAADESSAELLAAGGLSVFRPKVIAAAGGVRSWLRRAGQAQAVISVSGRPVVVTGGRADAAPSAASDI